MINDEAFLVSMNISSIIFTTQKLNSLLVILLQFNARFTNIYLMVAKTFKEINSKCLLLYIFKKYILISLDCKYCKFLVK